MDRKLTSNTLKQTFERRSFVVGSVQGGIGLLLAARMGYIAVAENEKYEMEAESNRVNLTLIPPRRGWILDRNGSPLASNRADFRVDIIPERLEDPDATVEMLGDLLGFSEPEKADLRDRLEGSAGFAAVPVANGLDYEKFAAVSVRIPELPGVIPQRGYSRFYPTGPSVGHLIGYVGTANAEEYAEQDRLFVPLDQISLVQKYAAPTDKPRLDHLGRASFKKVRERVEERIEEFAEELLKIYAARMSRKGYAYPPDSPWQEEFEAAFPFEETPDQITAIESVKQDMETPRPMDRLVCGDVGYGKTEVAIRAAFKAVMGGKQVAVICPTTILALQHFKNFKERYGEFPVRVDWISRFRTRKEVTETKQKLLEGEVDVVIGTHALLAKDIKFKNLGLLIVDEEQRFGVTHKEALKKMKALVDVLTLTATPIPRTLHLSLTGIRDLSIIQTPPRDRRPVQTFVMEDSDTVLVEAVERELERGGQVFYLHNRIQDLDAVAARIQSLMPDVSFTSLHGQMDEDDIENILLDFVNRKYDLLLTTAIIENGIDMPNVNTLIVDRADSFGLSQLYQIRGRVGRSSRQAYAYFFHPGKHILTEHAQKRLNTLLEYQELGSGFKVAMRDLEIRGAGNLLGKEQSGDIMDVGYELYIKFLDDAVRRLKGEEVPSDFRCAVNLKTDFYLPDDYIPDTRQKIEFYKRFEAAIDLEEVESLAAEMEDRFGEPVGAASQFVIVEKIRTLCSIAGFEKVFEEAAGMIQLEAGENFRIPPEHMIKVLKSGRGFRVKPGKSDTLYFEPPSAVQKAGLEERLSAFLAALMELTGPVHEKEKEVVAG